MPDLWHQNVQNREELRRYHCYWDHQEEAGYEYSASSEQIAQN